ncbi:MAG: VWA domain-containing protein [Ignavibacteriales bacterium]|nr:VWA domain-containing protein [Ignavibacteriales bacterium]
MLQFSNPDYLWALLALPLLVVLFILFHWKGKKLLRQLVAEKLISQLAPDASSTKRSLKQALLLLSLAFLILAAANPQVGTRLEEIKREGIDLFVALDVSLSMKAEDIKPSRLEKAKRDVSALLKKLSGDRVGLIVFAGDAFVQFPLTVDYAAADLFISAVDVESVPTPGTMIGLAVERAMKSFSTDLPTQKAIIVVTDGENTEGDVLGAVEEAKKSGVRVYTVGMGTAEGGPIPIYDANGQRVDFKRDRTGSVVVTRLDESMLQEIALSTGGKYRRATSAGNEIDEIFNELASLEKTEFGVKQVAGFESRYQFPLAAAIVLLILENVLSERKGRFILRVKKLLPAFGVFAAILAFVSQASAQTVRSHVNDGNKSFGKRNYTDAEVAYKKALEKDPKSREAQFNLGDAYYKQERFDEAGRQFNTSAIAMGSDVDRAQTYYNLGNSLFRASKIKESIEAYKQSLRLNPNDDDARYNLELARKRSQDQQQQQNQQKNQEKNQDKQEKQEQSQQQNQQQNQQEQQQQNQSQEAKQDKTQQQQAQKMNQMPKQQAERILEALRNNEKEVQKNLRKREGVRVKVEKDW